MHVTDSTPTANLIYELPSILERLDPAELFPRPQPLEVELGCGDASFLLAWAQQRPETNFLGIERLLGRLQKVDRKGRRRLGLTNVRGIRIESAYLLEYLLPRHATQALHIYFPDPWPKKRHRKFRLINERFPQLAHQVLASGGVVYLRTDDRDYFQAEPRFHPVETPAELAAVVTDFERDFNAQGIPTQRAAYQRE